MPRIVFATLGARGDVFPYLSVARELQKRGHKPVIATAESYRAEVEALGLTFQPVRPDSPRGADIRRAMHPISGGEWLFRRHLLPVLRESIEDLRPICVQAAILVTHTTTLAGPIVAALQQPRGLKWVSSAVSPLARFESDVALPSWPRAADFPALNRALLWLLKRQFGMYLKETQQIRAALGLSRGDNALWSDAHSPLLQLCLWDEKFAPVSEVKLRRAVGFCTLEAESAPDSALSDWLQAGEPPVVFVAASFSHSPSWERESERAAEIMGRRALLLGAASNHDSETVVRRTFASLSAISPRAAALVHAGGVGTLAQGLKFGVPMLLCPRAHDQPDNARRARRLGVARVLAPRHYRGERIACEIEALLGDDAARARLQEWRQRPQNGAQNAADALEALL
jgi:UDP:flavonoid glycosyltransferase YjiC (YdhE family)